MSSMTITVTAPDGRAKTTFTVPGTTLLKQILQKACLNLRLTLSEDSPEADHYSLRHGRNTLELSTSLRLSGLPAGAKLDLLHIPPREGLVQIALQHTTRQTGAFAAGSILWSILAHFGVGLKEEGGKVMAPCLVILGQEYKGLDKLVKTSLKGIGVVNGSCLIRVVYRPCEVESIQEAMEIVSKAPLTSPNLATIEKPSEMSRVPRSMDQSTAQTASTDQTTATDQTTSTDQAMDRNFILFTPPTHTDNLPTAPDLPENHYELGETEFRLHLAASQAHTRSLNDAPLVSRVKLLERQQAELLAKYPLTRIRFRMPDQFLLEAKFRSIETAKDLFDCIRGAMKESANVTLSVGLPPKLIKNDDTPLWRLDLVPASIVNLGFVGDNQKSASIFSDSILSTRTPLPKLERTHETLTAASTSATTKKPNWLRL